jgi:hypothetical protein
MNYESHCLKEIGNFLEKILRSIQNNKDDINSNIEELLFTKAYSLQKINEEKRNIFKFIVKKYEKKEHIFNFLNKIFDNNLIMELSNKYIDLNNIDYNIYKKDINKIEQEVLYLNSTKKIKLEELSVLNECLNNLNCYNFFKHADTNCIFNKFYINNRNKLLKNITNINYCRQYLNDKFYKYKNSRCLIKDEMKYGYYKEEIYNIRKELIQLELDLLEKKENLKEIKKSSNIILGLKEEDSLINNLENFFILNFEAQHFIILKEKETDIKSNFLFYYFNYQFCINLFISFYKDIHLLNEIYNENWVFYKKVRCFQYKKKNSFFEFNYKSIDFEILDYINQIKLKQEFISSINKITDKKEKFVDIEKKEDFLSYINNEIESKNINYYIQIFYNNKKECSIEKIFQNNINSIKNINLIS